MRGAWIEICPIVKILLVEFESLPVRGAWIEIPSETMVNSRSVVAPRAGSVD